MCCYLVCRARPPIHKRYNFLMFLGAEVSDSGRAGTNKLVVPAAKVVPAKGLLVGDVQHLEE
jgi:hypothetical protein